MKINRIQFENFNCFASREFRLSPRFNLLIGDNAAGKTTVLDGLAVGLGGLFLGFPAPAEARSIQRDEVRLHFYDRGETLTAEPQFPVVIECEGEVNWRPGEWRRELTSFEGRTTRSNANWIRGVANQLRHRIKAGKSAMLPLVSYYGTGRLWVQLRQREVKTLGPHSRFAGYLDCLNRPLTQNGWLRGSRPRKSPLSNASSHSRRSKAAARRFLIACPRQDKSSSTWQETS